MTILEPCCKIKQFEAVLASLHRQGQESFLHYGDVAFHEWFTPLILEAKGFNATIRFRKCDRSVLNYLTGLMTKPAFLPGKNLTLLNEVTISSKSFPDPIPSQAQLLIDQGRLTLQELPKTPRKDIIALVKAGSPSVPTYHLQGTLFQQAPNAPRRITITYRKPSQ